MELSELLNTTFECKCGKSHTIPTRDIVYTPDAVERVPEVLAGYVEDMAIIDYLLIDDVVKDLDFDFHYVKSNTVDKQAAEEEKIITSSNEKILMDMYDKINKLYEIFSNNSNQEKLRANIASES